MAYFNHIYAYLREQGFTRVGKSVGRQGYSIYVRDLNGIKTTAFIHRDGQHEITAVHGSLTAKREFGSLDYLRSALTDLEQALRVSQR